MENACVVLTTLDDAGQSRALAHEMVAMRLAACVQIVGQVESVYRWQGAVETAQECVLWIKTTQERVSALREWLLARHPYALPEFVVLPILTGSPDYLAWIAESTTLPSG